MNKDLQSTNMEENNMENTDIVIQGGLWENTYDVALDYVGLKFVKDVIISTWETESDKIDSYPKHDNIRWVFSPFPENFSDTAMG